MELLLSQEEHAFLSQTLTTLLGELRQEVRHTRDSNDREYFKQREKVLRGILEKLESNP